MARKLSSCRLVGGPYDGWSGEFVDAGQEVAALGPEGGESFIYRRSKREPKKGKPWVFHYDVALTRAALADSGVPAELIELAVAETPVDVERARQAVEHLEAPVVVQKIEIRRDGKGNFEMWADDALVDTVSEERVPDAETAKQWVASVMLPDKEAQPA